MTFFCGGSRNRDRFVDLFAAVFVLKVDPATLNGRLLTRPDDVFGGKPIERELILRQFETREDIPSNAASIDSMMPTGQVVDAILSQCG
jgi:hypothetical protein